MNFAKKIRMNIDTTSLQNNETPNQPTEHITPTETIPTVVKQNVLPSVITDRGIGNDPGSADFTPDAYDEDLTPYFLAENWPQPAWLLKEMSFSTMQLRERDYEDYILNNLRWRYLRLELDFRSSLNSFYNSPYFDRVIAGRLVSFLDVSRTALELKKGDPLNASSLLDLIDENMVWLYPPHYAKETATSMIADYKAQNNTWGDYLATEMNRPDQTLGGLRAAIVKIKEKSNQADRNTEVNGGLHIDQLKSLIIASFVVMVTMIIGLPIFLNEKSIIISDTFINNISSYKPWVAILCTSLVGTIAAFLSGLLQIRRTQVKIGEYRESIIQFQLRPIVGAIIASFVCVLLSWNSLGIKIDNVGVFLLVAFSCGFSERYFLNLLKINDSDSNGSAQIAPLRNVSTDPTTQIQNQNRLPRANEDTGDVNTRKL